MFGCPTWVSSIEGEGSVSLAVRLTTPRRNLKPSTKIGRGRATRAVIARSGRVKNISPDLPRKVTGSALPSLARPENWVRKSMCQDFRRISPSVMPWRPTPSWSATASRMAASSAAARAAGLARPASFSRRSALSEAGRSRLPTWSARKGALGAAIDGYRAAALSTAP